MNAEPQLEELSAYLDQQLAEGARASLEAHLSSCETCRRRLEALRGTVGAIRALPMESPPRAFSIPAQKRQGLRWGPPLAWAGGAAAAGLVLVVGAAIALQPGRSTSSGSPASLPQTLSQGAAPPPATHEDRPAYMPDRSATEFRNVASATNPSNPTQRLILATETSSYRVDGVLVVRVTQQGAPYTVASPGTLNASGIRLALVRDGYSVDLGTPLRTSSSTSGPTIEASYRMGDLLLISPRAGNYRLVATWSLPNAPGTGLVAEVSIQLEGSP